MNVWVCWQERRLNRDEHKRTHECACSFSYTVQVRICTHVVPAQKGRPRVCACVFTHRQNTPPCKHIHSHKRCTYKSYLEGGQVHFPTGINFAKNTHIPAILSAKSSSNFAMHMSTRLYRSAVWAKEICIVPTGVWALYAKTRPNSKSQQAQA